MIQINKLTAYFYLQYVPWEDQGEKDEPELAMDLEAKSGPVLNSFIYN